MYIGYDEIFRLYNENYHLKSDPSDSWEYLHSVSLLAAHRFLNRIYEITPPTSGASSGLIIQVLLED